MGNASSSGGPRGSAQSTASSKKSRKSTASRKSTGSSRTKTSISSSKKSMKSVDGESKNERLVRINWCEAACNQDAASISGFCHPSATCNFKGGGAPMSFPLFLESCKAIWASFPDNLMTWESIEEIRPGVVRVKNYRGNATHTGKPYSFGPYPPIWAKGAIVDEKPCHLTITMKRGKVVSFEINAYNGDLVGPPGYYQQIGGDLSAVPTQ